MKENGWYVSVEDWSRNRLVEFRKGAIAMEIARISCSHCSTCSKRMETVSRRVHDAGLKVDWERRDGGCLIGIPLPKTADPIEHLRKVLGLRITRC
jgi:hypothetical protein